jgi:hypothetical protein
MYQMCKEVDIEKICSDPALKPKLCPTGTSIVSDFCQYDPAKCTAAPTDPNDPNSTAQPANSCANDIYTCLAKRDNWGFMCREFPTLCFQDYTSGQMMVDDMCKAGYCGANNLVDMDKACSSY